VSPNVVSESAAMAISLFCGRRRVVRLDQDRTAGAAPPKKVTRAWLDYNAATRGPRRFAERRYR
jgi:hypothetical protein